MANEGESHMDSHHISARRRPPSLMDIDIAPMAINHSSLMDIRHHGALMAPGVHHIAPLLDDPDYLGGTRKKRTRGKSSSTAEGSPSTTLEDVVTLEYTGPLERGGNDQPHLAAKAKSTHHWLSEMPKKSRGDAALDRSRLRNVRRLRTANDQDNNILSKYLPSEARAFFPFGVEGPDDFRAPSSSWV